MHAPIKTVFPMTYVEHVIIGDAHTQSLNNWLVSGDDLQRPKSFKVKCENEVYCHWHGL